MKNVLVIITDEQVLLPFYFIVFSKFDTETLESWLCCFSSLRNINIFL